MVCFDIVRLGYFYGVLTGHALFLHFLIGFFYKQVMLMAF
jgi:hypothetical protein